MAGELRLKSQQFRRQREGDWRKLEQILADLEGGRRRHLSDDDVIALPVLYRATLSSLSMARNISLDRNLTDYLESLCTRAYFFVYGTRTSITEQARAFFVRSWPEAVRTLWRETIASAGLTLLGAAAGFALTFRSAAWFSVLVPAGLADGRGPDSSSAELARTLVDSTGADGLSALAGFLFTHNAQIALMAFALGFVFCLPTFMLMLFNGLMLGAFYALFYSHGLLVPFAGWTLIHGVTELFAVILAGAAGFHIGWRIAFPGRQSRLAAASEAGRRAAIVMGGVLIMLAFAALLEGFARQLIASTPARYTIAAATASIWAAYFYRPRRTK